ncbi:hypothetical protein L596_002820 [Steinernema carpocapsae]|uniref:Uncharacterized protein n=1 Tax=Steinernema carpocapsae TaxID=34508 RepID=A0A4U8US81_STECR|nr:hypothetical protein L596_002820 [Steinernema carpocapsae]
MLLRGAGRAHLQLHEKKLLLRPPSVGSRLRNRYFFLALWRLLTPRDDAFDHPYLRAALQWTEIWSFAAFCGFEFIAARYFVAF